MRVNIYYGGRGLIEDPTIYVINKITEVLEELRVEVKRYNLYEDKNAITTLPSTLKDADGVVLATTIEWLGIGGLMQQFLDACWLYSDKEKISNLYMLPVVMASTYGERDGECTLLKAWEMLGGIPCEGLCAYVADNVSFETNPEYTKIIEKKAESLYRNISQKVKHLPTSNTAVKQNILRSTTLDLTPQESEQLSMYVSDDTYVKKQKEDIKELTNMFKELLGEDEKVELEFISDFKKNFKPLNDFVASYVIKLSDTGRSLVIDINKDVLKCYYGEKNDATVVASTTRKILKEIVEGSKTFQGTFMSGELKAKGNFNILRTFDTVFRFDVI
jgi:multimeric flavodoxin WrbA